MKLVTEQELKEIMEGYKTVEPKSEPFERMAETLRVLWQAYNASAEHMVSCADMEGGFHAIIDGVRNHD